MSEKNNTEQNINELQFTSESISMESFVYSINNVSKEIIVGEDKLIKLIPLDKLVERENAEYDKPIKSILYENGKIFYNQEEKLFMCEYTSLQTNCLLTTLSSTISNILFNGKYNFIICYDEDDNIHIVDLKTKI